MELVVNEWLPEYLRPDTPSTDRANAVQFLQTFYNRGDKIVVKKDSAFVRKVSKYDKNFQYDLDSKKLFKQLIQLIFRDSARCKLLENQEIETLPSNITDLLDGIGNFSSDTYLFEAAMQAEDRIIITTDDRLVEQTQENGVIRVVLLADFLHTYRA
jgi:uncharacterized protein with PIN domain